MAKGSNLVDEFIARLPTEQQGIAHSLRDIIRTTAPALKETVKWGYPCYVGAGNVCSIMPYPCYVNLAFFRGTELPDPDSLLEGTGKRMRHVKVWSANDIPRQALGALVRAAASLESEE